jgi:RNA polymerase sigma factor (TIGR02999 family)
VLRAVIVDYARKRNAERRGGDRVHVTLNTQIAEEASAPVDDIERINDALIELEKSDPRLKQVVEMRFFGGLTEQEVAEVLGVSDRTVRSDWERARLLLSVTLKR